VTGDEPKRKCRLMTNVPKRGKEEIGHFLPFGDVTEGFV
jgi:hypothetical protein